MDRIFLNNIRMKCRVGTTAEERSEPQDVLVDVQLSLSLRLAGETDSLGETVDYRDVLERARAFASSREFILLEGLAEGLAAAVLGVPRARRAVVRVRKAKYSGEPDIGVEIEREAQTGFG